MVVCGSACVALETELGSVTQEVAIINMDNPFTFTMTQESHTFVVGVQSPTDNDSITAIRPESSSCQNFHLTPVSLPAHICGGSAGSGCPLQYAFTVTYTGTSSESCIFDIDWTSNGSGSTSSGSAPSGFAPSESGTTTLNLNSNVSAPAMSVSPATFDFGQIGSGTSSSPTNVTVTNTGSVPLVISGMMTGANTEVFHVSPIGSATLATHTLGVGSADTFQVYCTPPSVSTFTAALQFTAGAIVKSTNFTCQGVISGISISPSQISFPSTLVGRSPPNQSITISGNGMTTLTSVTLDAVATSNHVTIASLPAPGIAIPPSPGGIIVAVAYAADQEHSAGPLGKLILTTSDSATRQVAISGEALTGSIGTNPASVDLGTICVKTAGAMDVTVFANAAGSVILGSPPQPAPPFAYSASGSFPVQLRGNHLNEVTLHVTASPSVVGEVSSTLRLPNDIPGISVYLLALHAMGAAAGVTASPDLVQFGSIALNTSTSGREVTLMNCGKDNVHVSAASIIGPDLGEFAIVEPGSPARTLMPTERETFLVIMSSHGTSGSKSATLHIEYDGTASDVQLEGTVNQMSAPGKDRETYYGCQVAAGSSSLPGALVVASSWLLARRRRRGQAS